MLPREKNRQDREAAAKGTAPRIARKFGVPCLLWWQPPATEVDGALTSPIFLRYRLV
jgi:hypothetical protein